MTIVADADKIFSMPNEENGDIAELTLEDASNPGEDGEIQAGGPWQFVDLEDAWILCNGASVVFRTPSVLPGFASQYLVQNDYQVKTVCEWNGRVFFAGLDPNDTHPVWGSLDEREVFWTQIGGGDVFWPLVPSLSARNVYKEMLDKKDSGHAKVLGPGNVVALRSMKAGVVAYSDYGVTAFFHAREPFSTFGRRKLDVPGICNRMAVGAADDQQVWVDKRGNLWRMSGDFKPEMLRYFDQFYGYRDPDANIIFTHDPGQNEFHISDGSIGYILSPTGLAKTGRMTTSILTDSEGELTGVSYEDDDDILVTTDTYDMGQRTIKTIHAVQVGGAYLTDLECAIDWRVIGTDSPESFERSPWIPMNKEFVAYPMVSGVDLRVAIRGKAGSLAKIDYISIEWQMSDKRPLRGIYSNAAETAS